MHRADRCRSCVANPPLPPRAVMTLKLQRTPPAPASVFVYRNPLRPPRHAKQRPELASLPPEKEWPHHPIFVRLSPSVGAQVCVNAIKVERMHFFFSFSVSESALCAFLPSCGNVPSRIDRRASRSLLSPRFRHERRSLSSLHTTLFDFPRDGYGKGGCPSFPVLRAACRRYVPGFGPFLRLLS